MEEQKRKTWIPAKNREDDRRGSREDDRRGSRGGQEGPARMTGVGCEEDTQPLILSAVTFFSGISLEWCC